MRSHYTSFILLSACLFSCTSEKESQPLSDEALLGSWKLVKYIDHENGGTEWVTYSDDYVYQKHLTPTHFTWMKYKKSTDELEGIGGGRYTFENSTYTEDINFFLPAGSSELGQAIPFDVKIDENGLWHHDGYAKQFEFDVDAGEMAVVDSVRIEEIWEKVSPGANESPLMGTWNLESYRAQETDSLRSEYPSFVGYMKLVTSSHFVWIKYNTEGDEVMAAASGTYSYKSDMYVENIETCYPKGEGIVGTSPEFDAELDPNSWKHTGQVYQLDSAGAEPSTLLIDELWSKTLE
ncbi:MAG: hypothetical protein AAF693_03335 [Bacteroidota bacterium]